MLSEAYSTKYLPVHSRHLPLTLISMEDWTLVTITGTDTIKYLQGQLTCDVASLNINQYSFAAHCNATGKMISYLCVFHYYNGMAFIERRSVLDKQLIELKKYAIFSDINIFAENEQSLLGIAGLHAKVILKKFFTNIPNTEYPVVRQQDTILLYFDSPAPRYLLITTPTMRNCLQQNLKHLANFRNSQQWLALDIEAGFPIIDAANSMQFIPQAANVQMLGGINFEKGCYIGQEVVSRARYRGTNKRAMYWLSGYATHVPATGDDLEIKTENGNWKRTGTVLSACKVEGNYVWIQVILNKELVAFNQTIRVCNDNCSALFRQSLPYTIN